MNKQEILRKHLNQSVSEFQDKGKKETLDAMEEYAIAYHEREIKKVLIKSVKDMACPRCRRSLSPEIKEGECIICNTKL